MSGTGFGTEIIAAVIIREGGMCAMGCGRRAETANHRLNRKAGGRKNGSLIANACAICNICNHAIEDNADQREEALRRGVKCEEHQDPALTAMWHPFYQQWCLLGENLELTGNPDADLDARTLEITPTNYLIHPDTELDL